jgi:hypothetical protein
MYYDIHSDTDIALVKGAVMWKILQWFSNKPPYYCTHRDKNDPQFWDCTYSMRAGRIYIHTAEGYMGYISKEPLEEIIERLRRKNGWPT